MSNLIQIIKRDIPLLQYAEKRGLTFAQKGNHSEVFCKEMDSMSINIETNLFHRRSSGIGGSIIDFVMMVDEVDLGTAVSMLRKELPGYYQKEAGQLPTFHSTPKPTQQKEFTLPEKNSDYKRLFAYLVKTRKIAPKVVQDMVNRKMLFEDSHHNCAFVGQDQENSTRYCALRGTFTPDGAKPFKLEVAGSDKSVGWYVNHHASRLFVVEAPIEAMSIMTILSHHDKEYQGYNYLAIGTSGSAKSLARWMQHADPPIDTVYLSLNNDEAGIKGIGKLRQILREELHFTGRIVDKLPANNDFNDDLRALSEIAARPAVQNDLQKGIQYE